MIIFIYGADTFRSQRFLRELRDKFTRDVDPDANSFSFIDGSTAALSAIGERINTGSLFVKKRLVIIENIFQNKKNGILPDLLDYLKRIASSEDAVVIFRDEELNTKNRPLKADEKKLFNFLSQQPYSQEFKTLSDSQILTFIKKEAGAYHKDIGAPAASLLLNLSGNDLWAIAGHLKKLAFASTDKTITSTLIKELVSASYDENIFGLTDALSVKDKKLAASLLAEQYAAGLSGEYLLTMLIRQFKILLQIRSALDRKINPADLVSELKLHPFIIKKGALQARNFSAAALKNYLDRLIRLDFLNKRGHSDIATELTLLISGL